MALPNGVYHIFNTNLEMHIVRANTSTCILDSLASPKLPPASVRVQASGHDTFTLEIVTQPPVVEFMGCQINAAGESIVQWTRFNGQRWRIDMSEPDQKTTDLTYCCSISPESGEGVARAEWLLDLSSGNGILGCHARVIIDQRDRIQGFQWRFEAVSTPAREVTEYPAVAGEGQGDQTNQE